MNIKRFSATLPYSLDLITLRKTYETVYRNRRFSFFQKHKEYSQYVISVTFKYSVREYNRIKSGVYVKYGYLYDDVDLSDCICIKDGELIAVQIDKPVENPVGEDVLGKYFYYDNGCYHVVQNIKTIKSIADIRKELYVNGFYCNGIHYVRWKRSAGSARVGKCLFIAEPLYSRIHKSDMCGLKIKDGDQVDLAGLESYISLTLSSIIGLVEISPENILLIDDYDSKFKDKVVNVSEHDGKLGAAEEEVEITNCIWDGQSLIDPSLMGNYSQYGFILLRNKFFKSAAFNFNVQQFFKDHGITSVEQLNGITKAERIEDVKLIVTPSSIKYLKFGSYDQWLENAGSMFGVVKHEKPPHFMGGQYVSVHYQLLNSLQMSKDETQEFLQPTLDYLNLLKTDPAVLRYHIKYNYGDDEDLNDDDITEFSAKSKNDIVYKMIGINSDFTRTKLYADFKNDIIESFVKTTRSGHVLVNGCYCTMVGNPIEMALSACGMFDGNQQIQSGTVYTTRFQFGKTLIGTRSPHISSGNCLVVCNKYYDDIDKYCNLTDWITVVNSINENTLNRLSGADFDSDTVLLSDNKQLVSAAIKNYDNFLVPSGSVKSSKKVRYYTNEDKCNLDLTIATNLIGEIVNLSQELNTKYWHGLNNGMAIDNVKQYYIDAALLDVMSNLAIDLAKREFPVNLKKELKLIKSKYNEYDKNGRCIKPGFFGHIARQKGFYDSNKKFYKSHDTTMDYVQQIIRSAKIGSKAKTIPFSDIICNVATHSTINYDDVESVVNIVKDTRNSIKEVWSLTDDVLGKQEKRKLAAQIQQECIDYIDKMKMTFGTMRCLLQEIEKPENKNIYRVIFYSLFGAPNKSFYDLIVASKTKIDILEPVSKNGDICLYSLNFNRISV